MNRQTGARRGREWAIQPNVQIVHSSDSFLISFICFSLSFTARHLPLTPRLGEGILLIWQGRRPFVDEDETTFLFFPSKWTWRHNGGGWRRMWRAVEENCISGRLLVRYPLLFYDFITVWNWTRADCRRLYQWSASCAPMIPGGVFFSIAKLLNALPHLLQRPKLEKYEERERGGKGSCERCCCQGVVVVGMEMMRKHLRSCCSNIFSDSKRTMDQPHLNGYPERYELLVGERKHEKWMRNRGGWRGLDDPIGPHRGHVSESFNNETENSSTLYQDIYINTYG